MNDSSPSVPSKAPQITGKHRLLGTLWRNRGFFLILLDAATVVGCVMLSMYLVAFWRLPQRDLTSLFVKEHFKAAGLWAALWVALYGHTGGYSTGLRGVSAPMVRVRSLAMSGFYSGIIVFVLAHTFGFRALRIETCLLALIMASCVLLAARLSFRSLDRVLGSLGVVTQTVLVAGRDRQAQDFTERLVSQLGTIRILGFVADTNDTSPSAAGPAGQTAVGSLDEIESIFETTPFDNLVVSQGAQTDSLSDERLYEVLNFCEGHDIRLYVAPRNFDVAVTRAEVASFSGMPLVRLQDAFTHPGHAILKRAMDIVLSSVGIVVGGVLIGIPIAIMIRLTSKGPIIFKQTRVGLHGKLFEIYKFRTMVPDAEARLGELVDIDKLKVPGFKIKDDPRVTRVGRFLRRSGLDELPQLINVFIGNMSLVGPRPEMPQLVDRYSPDMRRRLKAKPGITGYQQIAARGLPLAAAVKYDLIYMKHQDLFLDFYILLRTIGVVLRNKEIQYAEESPEKPSS